MDKKAIQKKQKSTKSGQTKLLRERKLVKIKEAYYSYLDKKAKTVSSKLSRKELVTKLILKYIQELYQSAKSENKFKDDYFDLAYHAPISSELEFLIARILYHYSDKKNLHWKILLRRQQGKTAPDIRIEADNNTVAIIEIKAKAGWIQTIFNKERIQKEMEKYNMGLRDDPAESIKKFSQQCEKYYKTYHIGNDRVFILLPSLALVHRIRSKQKVEDYEATFLGNSGLADNSLILLSNNLILDLSNNRDKKQYNPTNRFEDLISKLVKLTKA